MATLDDIASALKKADAAGDTDGAKRLAQAYREMQASSQAPAAPDTAPKEKPTSQALGLGRGALRVWDNAALGAKTLLDPMNLVDKAGSLVGAPSAESTRAARDPYFAKQPSKPGKWGEFGGEVLATAPLAALGVGAAATGGLAGALTTDKDTPLGVAADTGLGAIGGKVLDFAGGAIGKAVKKPIQNATNAATEYVKNLAGKAGKSITDIERYAADKFGKPVTGAEAIGRTGKQSLTALGRREGTTPDALEGAMQARKLGASDRMLGDFAENLGVDPETAQGNLDKVVEKGRKEAAPLYDAAFSMPPVITDRLQEFANEPIVQEGMRRGIKIERLKALAEGRKFDPNAYAITSFNAAGDPIIGPVPTWRTWDAAKVGLDNVLESYRDPRTGKLTLDKMGDAINSVRASMLKELDGVNKLYGTARKAAGDYLSARAAFDRAQKGLLNSNLTEKQFADMWGKMSAMDVESGKGGIANQLFNMAQNGRLKPNLLRTPRVQAKLETAFGKQGAKAFTANLEIESEMAASGARMAPGTNSVTSDVLNATTEQDKFSGAAMNTVKAAWHAARGRPIAALGHIVTAYEQTWGKSAGMSVDVRNEVGRMLMMPPEELAAHLKTTPIGRDPNAVRLVSNLVELANMTLAAPAGIAVSGLNANTSPQQ